MPKRNKGGGITRNHGLPFIEVQNMPLLIALDGRLDVVRPDRRGKLARFRTVWAVPHPDIYSLATL